MMFNGSHHIVGASLEDAQGGQYMDVIRSRYYDPAPVRVVVDSFDSTSGAVSATVTMYSTTDALTGPDDQFRLILIEDGITGENTHVTRAVISTPITLSGAGNAAPFSETFTIDPAWDPDQLRVVAIVQRQDKRIVQTGSSYDQPGFSVRAMVPFERTKIGPSTVTFETPDLTLINVGRTETFTIGLVVDEAPPGWTAGFSDGTGNPHTDLWSFGLTEQASTTFKVSVTPGSAGYMRYHLEVTSPNLVKNLEIPFVFITDDVDVLLVNDDGGNDYGGYFTAAMEDIGLTYGVWNLSSTKLNDDVASAIDLLVWNIGLGYPSLDAVDRAFVERHLDAGKSLFITGQDIGWDLNDSQSGNTDVAFYESYLHAEYISDDVNMYDVEGVPGDPVSDGVTLHIRGGDGANNQDYPSRIAPVDSDAVEIFSYTGEEWGAAVRSIDSASDARVVYLAFGFEAIDNAEDRATLLRKAVNWLSLRYRREDWEQEQLIFAE